MYVMAVVSNKILLRIRQDLYEHIQTLSFSFDSRPTGKILARIIGDVNSLRDVLVNVVTTLIPELITVIGVVVIMLIKDWRLALASLQHDSADDRRHLGLCRLPRISAGRFSAKIIQPQCLCA